MLFGIDQVRQFGRIRFQIKELLLLGRRVFDVLPVALADHPLKSAKITNDEWMDFIAFPFEDWLQALAIDFVWDFQTAEVGESRENVPHVTLRGVSFVRWNSWTSHEQRHADRVFVHALFSAEPVAADAQPVVAAENDDGVFEAAG